MMAWSSLAHSVYMQCLRSSRSVMHVLYTLSCSIPHSRGRMNCGISLLAKTAFVNDVTSMSLHSVVQVLMGLFITTFQSHGLLGWFMPKIMKSCLNLSKLCPKYCRSLFSGHSVVRPCFTIFVQIHRVLRVTSEGQPFILHTDSSGKAVGASLGQLDGDGVESC